MTKQLIVLLNKIRNLVETYNKTAKGEQIKVVDVVTVKGGSETLNFIDDDSGTDTGSSSSESQSE